MRNPREILIRSSETAKLDDFRSEPCMEQSKPRQEMHPITNAELSIEFVCEAKQQPLV